MSRRTATQSLTRLLGQWQESPSRMPLWQQLALALRLLILDGRLALDSRLPGERELATALAVSRTTIASALSQLRAEGYLASRQGSGSRVVLPENSRAVPTRSTSATALDLSTAALGAGPGDRRPGAGTPGRVVVRPAARWPRAVMLRTRKQLRRAR